MVRFHTPYNSLVQSNSPLSWVARMGYAIPPSRGTSTAIGKVSIIIASTSIEGNHQWDCRAERNQLYPCGRTSILCTGCRTFESPRSRVETDGSTATRAEGVRSCSHGFTQDCAQAPAFSERRIVRGCPGGCDQGKEVGCGSESIRCAKVWCRYCTCREKGREKDL